MKSEERKSNFELMRIISMLFIVFYHFTLHGGVLSNCQSKYLSIILDLLICASLVHVNSFVLLTGYFQSDSNIKQSKIWKLINQTWFYRVAILCFLLLTDRIIIGKVEIFKEIFIINLTEYWYAKIILIIYLLSPFFNKFIKILAKKEFKRLLITLFIVISVLPYLTNGDFYKNDGFGIVHFIFLYFIGAYIRKYKVLKKLDIKKKRIVYVSIIIICILINKIVSDLSCEFLNRNYLISSITETFSVNKLNYSNPILIIQSISYFLLFETFEMKNKFINKVSLTSFGVYLIHDNQLLKQYVYSFFKLGEQVNNFIYLFYLMYAVMVMFLFGCLVEKIRLIIFSKIYNLKISEKVRNIYYKKINSKIFL